MKKSKRSMAFGRAGTTTFLAIAVMVAVATTAIASNDHPTKNDTPNATFTITNSVSSSATVQNAALLYPGVLRYLWYTVNNPNGVPITVSSIRISSVTAPPNCPTSNLDYSHTTFSGSLLVPPHGSQSVSVPISLVETHTNQNRCEGTSFNFTFAGTAALNQLKSSEIALVSSPNPSVLGHSVTFTATVDSDHSSTTPTGLVDFFIGTPHGSHVLLGVGSLSGAGVASITTSTLALGTTLVYAAYLGDSNFSPSNSDVLSQLVQNIPSVCQGQYDNSITASPANLNVIGTNHRDAISAFGANYTIDSRNGDDCIVVGDGNNAVTGGNGDDLVVIGNGNNRISLGNGDDRVTTGNGSNSVNVGNGEDTIALGNGSNSTMIVGNGPDSVTVGSGSYITVSLGNGNDVVTILGGSHDTVNGGNGRSEGDDDGDNHGSQQARDTVYLGNGTFNTFHGTDHQDNVCHLPAPPSTWHGPVAAYYHDTITNCTVVTP